MSTPFLPIKTVDPVEEICERIRTRAGVKRLVCLDVCGRSGDAIAKAMGGWFDMRTEKSIESGSGKRYDVALVNNTMLNIKNPEHFNLFPHIWKWLDNHAFLVLSVCRDIAPYIDERSDAVRKSYGLVFRVKDALLGARRKFYGKPDPLTMDDIEMAYRSRAELFGYRTVYSFHIDRSKRLSFLLLEVRK